MGGNEIAQALVQFLVFMFAITVHESSHALTADRLGDPTARQLGRISLNPLRHIDPVGSVLFPLMLAIFHLPVFGWAKPVPVSVWNLRHPRRDYMLVAAAGPASNLVLAAVFAVIFYLFRTNLGVIPPAAVTPIFTIVLGSCVVNTYLAVFNMIPIHPLDGCAVLAGLLSEQAAASFMQFQRYGFVVLFLLLYTGLIDVILNPVAGVIFTVLGLHAR